MQRIIPYLSYRDAPAAITFLCKAFGFTERMRYPMPDGRMGHAELVYRDDLLFLSSCYEGFGTTPLELPAVHGQTFCVVDDVDAHFVVAQKGGATIVQEPTNDHGQRMYRAMDLEGHHWIFSTLDEAGS